MVTLLARGLTDDAVSRRLGLSKRTYRRRLRSAMNKLGASSRFQAGALAVLKGWVGPLPDQGSSPRHELSGHDTPEGTSQRNAEC